jgi:hypothetical protein
LPLTLLKNFDIRYGIIEYPSFDGISIIDKTNDNRSSGVKRGRMRCRKKTTGVPEYYTHEHDNVVFYPTYVPGTIPTNSYFLGKRL